MKKWMNSLVAGLLVLGIASPAWAASSSGKASFSGSSSHSVPSVFSSSTNSVHSSGTQRPSSSVPGNTDPSNKVYNSGPQRPSSVVTQQPSSTTQNQPATGYTNAPYSKPKFGGVGSFLGGIAVGGLLGSMFHPFGGGMNVMGGAGGFSFMGLLMDVLIIGVIIWAVRKFLRRA